MKKTKDSSVPVKKYASKEPAKIAEPQKGADQLDDDERGFGGWLRSSDGMETMKLFVIANSVVMLTTLVLPHLQTVVDVLKDMIFGEPFDDYA